LAVAAALAGAAAQAEEITVPTPWLAFHAQATLVEQGALGFRDPYSGTNSLSPSAGRETFDATLLFGVQPWRGGELWIDPEVDQGFGLNNTLGVAGFPSAEAYKVGESSPYLRLPRFFVRQTFDLGGAPQPVDADLNQFAARPSANRVVVTIGKFGVPDVFDTNRYAHDPRGDFLNWALVDTGTFDYAADAWGFTYGAAVEWYQGRWTLRTGAFDQSVVPNSSELDPHFGQDQFVAEVEERHSVGGQPGRIMLTGFLTRGRMGAFGDAIALAEQTGQTPNTADVRRYRSRPGLSLDLEQQVREDLGVFLRAGEADGHVEPFAFTDIDETVAGGVSVGGKRWGRGGDTIGLAGIVNEISKIHQQYFADGGLGILVGDGRLPRPGPEEIVEAYYKIGVTPHVALTFDAQLVTHPGYNRDRGPAPILAARIHAQF
jgi:high affinity Mn2+ porin